ncbi:hypothetical protein [Marinobacterium sp. BA1]|uniref:hypothetical protein n=1 Tax=Marinobacterium sp. BA1 TaxID=3138931 RepID=UPI0032E5AA2A
MEQQDLNVYQVSTEDGAQFRVSALDSDQACWKANRYAAENSILSSRATLSLVHDDASSPHDHLGQFDLEGYALPVSWGELKDRVSWARKEAVRNAIEHWDYPCHRSRGVFITARDAKGEMLLTEAEAWSLASTRKQFKQDLTKLMQNNPELVSVWAVASVNSANNLEQLNDDPEPLTGGKEVLIWHRDHPQGSLDIVFEDDPLAQTQSRRFDAKLGM